MKILLLEHCYDKRFYQTIDKKWIFYRKDKNYWTIATRLKTGSIFTYSGQYTTLFDAIQKFIKMFKNIEDIPIIIL